MIQLEALTAKPTVTTNEGVSLDLFALGREATAKRISLHGSACIFARSRRLLSTGTWQGPKDAADSFVEDADVQTNGGLPACAVAGVKTLVASSLASATLAQQHGLRVLLRMPYRSGEPPSDRTDQFVACQAEIGRGLVLHGVVPTPVGEAFGLDTLMFMASCRLSVTASHVVADFARLGHRLAQMSLAFGASELFGPIVGERALRLGDNANNPAMTRKEVAVFIRAAGLVPHERLASGRVEEVVT